MKGRSRIERKNVLVRSLEAQDLPAVSAVHMAAFPDSALTMLGAEAVRRYYEWQLTSQSEATAIGGFAGGKVVGFCFGGIFRGAMSGFLHKNRIFLVWRLASHPWLALNPIVRERLKYVAHIVKRLVEPKAVVSLPKTSVADPFGILSIATHPHTQGLGVGKLLMKEIENVARQRDFREMLLTVHPDNHQAITFYESLGWEKIPNNGAWEGGMKKYLQP